MSDPNVSDWQAGPGRVDYFGNRLGADGNLGAKTRWAMYLETLDIWRQVAVRSMLFWRGLHEDGVNRGALQDRVLALCGAPPGSPYCAATYSWALWVAGCCSRFGFSPNASVVALRASLLPVPFEQVQPGDFASIDHGDGTGHGGMVIWPGKLWLASCDANISDETDVVRYPASARQYFSPTLGGFSRRPGEVPELIRIYGKERTR